MRLAISSERELPMMTNRLTRVLVIVVALALSAMPVGTAAAGDGPIRVRAPFVPFTISGLCDFDVFWEALADKGYYTIHTDQDATRYILTGVLKSRLTNLQTGKYVDLSNSSNYTQVYYDDGSASFTSSGPAIWFEVPGIASLAYVRGRVSLAFDPYGNLVATSVAGIVEDLCVTLGD
jgi:hypothetical protein